MSSEYVALSCPCHYYTPRVKLEDNGKSVIDHYNNCRDVMPWTRKRYLREVDDALSRLRAKADKTNSKIIADSSKNIGDVKKSINNLYEIVKQLVTRIESLEKQLEK